MLERLLLLSVQRRWLIFGLSLALAVLGFQSWSKINLDAFPDITPNQVQIITDTGGLAPEEIESLVTYPIETAVRGAPKVVKVRSLSQYGISIVSVIFDETIDVYLARQQISERIQRVRENLPPGVETPRLGPISTGLGEVYMYTISSPKRDTMDLRELQDYVVGPQLRAVPGVADLSPGDTSVRQFEVRPDPERLVARGLSIGDLTSALQANNENAGGGVLDRNGQRLLVRSIGAARNESEIGSIVVATEGGVPVLVRDVATVGTGVPVRSGIGTRNGEEAMVVMVLMLQGANGREVATAVDEKVKEIRKGLPPDVELTTDYNRSELVDTAIFTVFESLAIGGVLVIVVLLVLLGNLPGALIAASAIPMAMLFAVVGMEKLHVSGNLMSLGAIDFGIIVDGAVIMVENCVRRLSERREQLGRTLTKEERSVTVAEAASEVRKVTQFGEMIIIATFLPIFALEGTEGKMFRPMAAVFVLALVGALILSLTLVPSLCATFLSRDTKEKHNVIMSFFDRLYKPVLNLVLRRPWPFLVGAAALVIASVVTLPKLGTEFVPQLDEGDLIVQPTRQRAVGEAETIRMVKAAEKAILKVPQVQSVFSRSGTPEAGTDPMPLSLTDSFVRLKPRSTWPAGMTKAKIQDSIAENLKSVAGQTYAFTQPIEMRFSELESGVKADVGIAVVGEDLDMLRTKAEAVAAAVKKVPGVVDVEVEQVDRIPILQYDLDREEMGRLGVPAREAQEAVRSALASVPVGEIVRGDRRFDLVVRLPEALRTDQSALGSLPVRGSQGIIRLTDVAKAKIADTPAQISREDGKRRVIVQLNVRGRDLGGTVAEIQRKVKSEVQLPAGTYFQYGGQFENLERASARLRVVVPIALVLIFGLLVATFGSVRPALIIFTGVPLAATGGVFALALRGLPFSISAGVGFIALSGVAVLNGVVLVSAINRFRDDGMTMTEAVRSGAIERLRPVLMTALVAALGFIPMAVNTGIGAEVQRPLATVVIGGILSATLLTLLVLPALYSRVQKEAPRETEV